MSELHAVLTGDLVDSTAAAPARTDAAMRLLTACATDIDDNTRFSRFRGDGWQMYLSEPGRCLHVCLYIMARLAASPDALPTRISVGIGTVQVLGASSLEASMGDAFTLSGRGLDDMRKGQRLAISGEDVGVFQTLAFAFAEDIVTRWTIPQAQAMAHVLSPHMQSHAAIAERLGVTRPAIDQRVAAARWPLLEQASAAFFAHYGPSHA